MGFPSRSLLVSSGSITRRLRVVSGSSASRESSKQRLFLSILAYLTSFLCVDCDDFFGGRASGMLQPVFCHAHGPSPIALNDVDPRLSIWPGRIAEDRDEWCASLMAGVLHRPDLLRPFYWQGCTPNLFGRCWGVVYSSDNWLPDAL